MPELWRSFRGALSRLLHGPNSEGSSGKILIAMRRAKTLAEAEGDSEHAAELQRKIIQQEAYLRWAQKKARERRAGLYSSYGVD